MKALYKRLEVRERRKIFQKLPMSTATKLTEQNITPECLLKIHKVSIFIRFCNIKFSVLVYINIG